MMGTLIMMVKAPIAGRVKTRLAADLGVARASCLYRAMLRGAIEEATAGSWRTIAAVAPTVAMSHPIFATPALGVVPQSNGSLGDRLIAAIEMAPKGPVIVIGGDAPQMRRADLQQAFTMMRRHDAVFGRAEDGGFWLMGLARRQKAPTLMENVRWSSRHTLADTVASLPRNFKVGYLKTLIDVDHAEDLARLGARPFLRSVRRP